MKPDSENQIKGSATRLRGVLWQRDYPVSNKLKGGARHSHLLQIGEGRFDVFEFGGGEIPKLGGKFVVGGFQCGHFFIAR
jgi:hypothetical protein